MSSKDRSDLVDRVFRLKLEALLEDIHKNGYLGRVGEMRMHCISA